jgi:ubiquitin-protein ligase E3 D
MSISTILMYAELHSNIGHISIIAALETPCNSSTKAEISSDGQQFLLRHDGKAKTLNLPGAVSTSIRLEPTALGSKELTWRLPLAGRPGALNADSSDAPWPAKDLNEGTEFLCRGCGGAVMGRGSIKEWKDLPSENWAEMMDFWHCHKPTVPEPSGSDGHSHDDPAMGRGYGAHTKFSAQPKIGFVDLTTVLFAEEDCLGVEVRYSYFLYLSLPMLVRTCSGGY